MTMQTPTQLHTDDMNCDPFDAYLGPLMVEIALRKATDADIPAIMNLVNPLADAGKLFRRSVDEIAELFPEFFIAEVKGQVVGCCAIEIYSRKIAEIQCLAVHADYRRHGIGKQLVEACVQVGLDQGIVEIMAITSDERFFRDCAFDYSLPNAKKALFFHADLHTDRG